MSSIKNYKKESYENISDEAYKQKYLKYKNKYLELKQRGGLGNPTGIVCFFTSMAKATEVSNLFSSPKPPNFDTISEMLHNDGYYIVDGGNLMELMIKPKKITSFFGKKPEVKPEEKPEVLKQNKVKLAQTKIFNRCDTNHIQDVKTVLGAYTYKPDAMFVILLKSVGSDTLITEKPVSI